ncbi:MAG: PqqD family protein [Planctomycetes bacterium]|nr:PqqD family protein [Planctomycetota bacterium]
MSLLTPPNYATSNYAPSSSTSWSDGEAIIPARQHDVRDYQIDGEAVLFNRRFNKLYMLNWTALAVWDRCDGRTTIRQVAKRMSGDHDIAFETALDHVEELVAAFSSMNLLNHDVA